MLDNGTKRRIDNARDILVGKVPDPKAQVEQITTALIYKFMDDMDQESIALGGKASFFVGEYAKYAWPKVIAKSHSGYERLALYSEAITEMSQNPHLPQLFRDIFKGAFLPYRDPETLNLFLKEINGFTYDNSERLGDAFEYLLSIMGSQGAAGQFRTPRHIIDFIVEVVAPTKTDTVLDPACGTAGFLISAYKHILARNQEKKLSPDEMLRLTKNFVGYDISPDMVRLSLVNMYLHQFQNPTVFEYDTLTSEERWDDSFDVILANPPFMSPKGGIRPHTRFAVQAKRSEVLFVDYIAEHLNPNGRAGVIVPEGIIFQSAKAYKALRKMLIEEHSLYAVVSMPAGVFNPYSGVKTSILLMDRTLAKRTDSILFVNIENDGYGLGAQRRKIESNDLPEAVKVIKEFQGNPDSEPLNPRIAHIVTKSKIAENGEFYLSGGRYKDLIDYSKVKWSLKTLGDVFDEINNGVNVKQFDEKGKYRVTRIATISKGKIDLISTKWTNDDVDEKHFLKRGDILLSHINSIKHIGKTAIFTSNEKVIHGINLIKLRPNKKRLNPVFAIYIFKSKMFINVVKKYAQRAVNQASVKTSDLRNINIPLPPLEMQQAIVDEVEEYQKIIDGARQVVENYRPRIKVDPDWPMVELGDLVSVKGGKRLPKGESFTDSVTHHPYLRVVDFSNFSIDKSNLRYINDEVYSKIKNYTISVDDIFISIAGTIGAVGMVPLKLDNANLTENAAKLRIFEKNRFSSKFIMYSIASEYIQTQIANLTHAVGVPKLALSRIKTIKVYFPNDLETQLSIVKSIEKERGFIKGNSRLIEIFEKKIEEKIGEVWGEE